MHSLDQTVQKEKAGKSKTRILSLVALAGVAHFGLTILLLSLLTTTYSPITQAASDYGVGPFATEMNLGFFVGGIGIIAFATAMARHKPRSIVGSAFLDVAGAVLIMDSYFTTNLEGAPATLHGTIHGFGGFFFFLTAPIGMILVSRKFGRKRFFVTLAALIVAYGFLFANSVLPNTGGLAERIILLVIFSSVIAASLKLYRTSKGESPS